MLVKALSVQSCVARHGRSRDIIEEVKHPIFEASGKRVTGISREADGSFTITFGTGANRVVLHVKSGTVETKANAGSFGSGVSK